MAFEFMIVCHFCVMLYIICICLSQTEIVSMLLLNAALLVAAKMGAELFNFFKKKKNLSGSQCACVQWQNHKIQCLGTISVLIYYCRCLQINIIFKKGTFIFPEGDGVVLIHTYRYHNYS